MALPPPRPIGQTKPSPLPAPRPISSPLPPPRSTISIDQPPQSPLKPKFSSYFWIMIAGSGVVAVMGTAFFVILLVNWKTRQSPHYGMSVTQQFAPINSQLQVVQITPGPVPVQSKSSTEGSDTQSASPDQTTGLFSPINPGPSVNQNGTGGPNVAMSTPVPTPEISNPPGVNTPTEIQPPVNLQQPVSPTPGPSVPPVEPERHSREFDPSEALQQSVVIYNNGTMAFTNAFHSEYQDSSFVYEGVVARHNDAEHLVVFKGGGIYPFNWDIQLRAHNLRTFPIGSRVRVLFILRTIRNTPFGGWSFRGDIEDRL